MAKRVSAQEAYGKYVVLSGMSPKMQRRLELARTLAARRPAVDPNLKHRLAVADRFIRIFGIKVTA